MNSESSSPPAWKKDYPVRQSEEHRASRREFAKFLGCVLVCGAGLAAARPLVTNRKKANTEPLAVAGDDEIPVDGYKLFRYPTENDPCILIRLEENHYAAFSQSCTHLTCPVHFQPETKRLYCPCHEGYFSAEDGSVLAGPPPRPLPAYPVEIRHGKIWVAAFD